MKRENAVTLICIRIPHMLIQVFFLIEMVQQFYCTVKFVQNKSLVLTFKKSTFYAKKWTINPSFGREFLLLARSKMPDSVIFWTFFPKFVFHFSIFYTGGYWGIGHGLMSSQVWACIVIEQNNDPRWIAESYCLQYNIQNMRKLCTEENWESHCMPERKEY